MATRAAATAVAPRLLGLKQSGLYLGKCARHIRAMVRRGELPFIKGEALRAPILIDVRDLDRWIRQNKVRNKKVRAAR